MDIAPKLSSAELLYRHAHKMGLKPAWISPGGLFAVTTNNGLEYVNSCSSSLNSHTSVSLSKNKYLTRLICEQHNLPNIPFMRPKTAEQAQQFLAKHRKIIVKPVSGSGSRDIHIVDDIAQIANLDISLYIFEKYILGKEMRYLILNGSVIGVHHSEYGTSVDEHRDLQRISLAQADWDADLTDMSIKLASIIGLKFGAIDYLVDDEDNAYILEVNSAPGIKWFHAPTSGPPIDVARLFLEAMVRPTHI